MAFPASVDTVTLTVGPLYDAGGLPRRGVPLTARLSVLVKIAEGGATLPTTTTARTDETGEASLTLVATDSAGVDTTGFTYRVSCPGVLAAAVDVALPAAAPTVAVESLVAAAASDGEIVNLPLITADAAIAGLVADVDSDTRAALEALGVGGGGASTLDDLTDVATTGAATGKALTYNGSSWAPGSAAAILEGDARLTDARTPSAHTHPASEISDSTATGRAVVTATDAAAARTAIGAGTSSFDGAYSSLSGKPTLGTAAAAATTDFATAAQGTDARTPTAHKASHATGGGDALTAADIGAAAASHNHAASEITSGTVATARLGSGTASASTFLRGDQTWAAPAPAHVSPVAGRARIGHIPGSGSWAYNASNLATFYPVFYETTFSVDQFGVHLRTTSAGSTVRLGLFANAASGFAPGEVAAQTSLGGDTSGWKAASITPVTNLPAGWYWHACVTQGGAMDIFCLSAAHVWLDALTTENAIRMDAFGWRSYQATVAGAFANNPSVSPSQASAPTVSVRFA